MRDQWLSGYFSRCNFLLINGQIFGWNHLCKQVGPGLLPQPQHPQGLAVGAIPSTALLCLGCPFACFHDVPADLGLMCYSKVVCLCRAVADPGPPIWACPTSLVGLGDAWGEGIIGSPHPAPPLHPAQHLPGRQHLIVISGLWLFQLK